MSTSPDQAAAAPAAPPSIPEMAKPYRVAAEAEHQRSVADGTVDLSFGTAVHPAVVGYESLLKTLPFVFPWKETAKLREVSKGLALLTPPLDASVKRETYRAEGVTCDLFVYPTSANADPTSPTLIYYHGGAYCMCTTEFHLGYASEIARMTGLRVLVPDYRLVPDVPFADLVEDCMKAYHYVLTTLKVPANSIGFAGDSAGGGLTFIVTQQAIKRGWPVPRAIVALAPLVDNSLSGESLRSPKDLTNVTNPVSQQEMCEVILQGHDARDPLFSPLFGSFKGFPPTYIMAAKGEWLWSDATRSFAKLREANVAGCRLVGNNHSTHVSPVFMGAFPDGLIETARWTQWIADRIAPDVANSC